MLARLPFAANVLAVVDLAAQIGKPIATVAKAYFMLSEKLNMSWIYRAIAKLPSDNLTDRRYSRLLPADGAMGKRAGTHLSPCLTTTTMGALFPCNS